MGFGSEPQYNTLHRILDKAMRKRPDVLRALRVLKLQSDMDGNPWAGFDGMQVALQPEQNAIDGIEVQWDACPALFGAPNLSEFKVLGHSLRGLKIPRQIKVLSISGYYRSSTARLFLLHSSGLIAAPATLENLTLHPFPQYYGIVPVRMDRRVAVDRVDASEISWSLGMYEYFIWLSRTSLKSLDLQTMGRWSALAGCWKYDHSKRLRGIRCLPQMRRLEQLTIELGALVGSPARCGQTRLEEILPPNLGDLVLIERWRPTCHHRSCQQDCLVSHNSLQYATGLLKMLNGFARHQPSALPSLRHLTLVCNGAWRMDSLAEVPRCPSDADAAALLRTLKGTGWNGCDTYHKDKVQSPDRESFASAYKTFAKNGVAFDVGLLERGKYYTLKPSREHRYYREGMES